MSDPGRSYGRKNVGIQFARHDGSNDPQTGDAAVIPEHMVQLKVHQRLCLLHVRCRVLEMAVQDPHVGA
jgi:hypothetical protein